MRGVQGEGLEDVQVLRKRGIRVDKTAVWVGRTHEAGSGTFVVFHSIPGQKLCTHQHTIVQGQHSPVP